MNSQDNELFELCKQVHEKAGWDEPNLDDFGNKLNVYGQMVPLYTSDYLLEKLPTERVAFMLRRVFYKDGDLLWIVNDATTIDGDGNSNSTYHYVADTPLKALLKLTLALKEAGEL